MTYTQQQLPEVVERTEDVDQPYVVHTAKRWRFDVKTLVPSEQIVTDLVVVIATNGETWYVSETETTTYNGHCYVSKLELALLIWKLFNIVADRGDCGEEELKAAEDFVKLAKMTHGKSTEEAKAAGAPF